MNKHIFRVDYDQYLHREDEKKNQQHEKGCISEEIYEFEGISFKINHRNF